MLAAMAIVFISCEKDPVKIIYEDGPRAGTTVSGGSGTGGSGGGETGYALANTEWHGNAYYSSYTRQFTIIFGTTSCNVSFVDSDDGYSQSFSGTYTYSGTTSEGSGTMYIEGNIPFSIYGGQMSVDFGDGYVYFYQY